MIKDDKTGVRKSCEKLATHNNLHFLSQISHKFIIFQSILINIFNSNIPLITSLEGNTRTATQIAASCA